MNIQSFKKVVVSNLTDLHSGFSTTNSLLTHIYIRDRILHHQQLKSDYGCRHTSSMEKGLIIKGLRNIYIEYDHPTHQDVMSALLQTPH